MTDIARYLVVRFPSGSGLVLVAGNDGEFTPDSRCYSVASPDDEIDDLDCEVLVVDAGSDFEPLPEVLARHERIESHPHINA